MHTDSCPAGPFGPIGGDCNCQTCPHRFAARYLCHVCNTADSGAERKTRKAQQDPDHTWSDTELSDLAQSITYKPGYQVRLQNHPDYPMAKIVVVASVWDSTAPTELFQLTFEQTLPRQASRDHMLESIRRAFHVLEAHEADEWFRVDGRHVKDPHGQVAR